jgi:hypothetical protein
MHAVVSTLFCVLRFPHQGKIITFDQLVFFNYDSHIGNVPFILKTPSGYENVSMGVLKDSTLMGTFSIPPPDIPCPFVTSINMISTYFCKIPESHDPCIVPRFGDYLRYNDIMSLSLVESTYQDI